MRIAVLIISLCLVAVIGLQSCAVYGLTGATLKLGEIVPQTEGLDDASKTQESAAIGVVVAFLFLLGRAFIMGAPTVSITLFSVAALLGFASSSAFPDLQVWGGIALALAVMSLLGRQEAARKKG